MTPGQDDVEILQESYPVWYSKIGVRPFMNLHNIIQRIRSCPSIQKNKFTKIILKVKTNSKRDKN